MERLGQFFLDNRVVDERPGFQDRSWAPVELECQGACQLVIPRLYRPGSCRLTSRRGDSRRNSARQHGPWRQGLFLECRSRLFYQSPPQGDAQGGLLTKTDTGDENAKPQRKESSRIHLVP